jgi:ABC-type multidrug transport system fused ATPase/permease subunit
VKKNLLPHQRLLWTFLSENKWPAFLYVTVAFLSGVLKITLLMLLGRGYELMSSGQSARTTLLKEIAGIQVPEGMAYPLLFAGTAALFAVVLFMEKLGAALLGERFVAAIRIWVFARHIRIPAEKITQSGYGRYLIRYGSDLSGLKRYVVRGWCRFLSDGILALGILAIVLKFDRFSGMVLIAVLMGGMLILSAWQRLLDKKVRTKRSKQSRLLDFVVSRFDSITAIQEQDRYKKVEAKFDEKNRRIYTAAMDYNRWATPAEAIAETMPYFALAALLVSAVMRQTPPSVSVLILLLTLFPIIRRISKLPSIWRLGAISLYRLDALDGESGKLQPLKENI